MAPAVSRSTDMRRIESTRRVLSELSAALIEFEVSPLAWWIELGALEPPSVSNAVRALALAVSAAAWRFDAALGEVGEDLPDPIAEPVDVAFSLLAGEIGRLIAEGDAALERLGNRQ